MAKNNKNDVVKKNVSVIILLLVTMLGPSLSQIYLSQEAEAAVADIEILSNIETNNTSYTTPDNRWQTTSEQELELIIQGNGLASISPLLTGSKTAVLIIPPELVHSFQPTGNALIETNLTVDLRRIPLLSDLFLALDGLLKLLVDILNGSLGALVGVNLNLDEVYRQVDLLNSLQNLPNLSFHEQLVFSQNNHVLTANIDNGLGRILAENMGTILHNLQNAVSALRAEGRGLGIAVAELINLALAPVKATLIGAIQALFPLLGLGGSLVSSLADASLLGNTTVTISGRIAPLEETEDIEPEFHGTVVKSAVIDIDVLSNTSGNSSVYYRGERFGIVAEMLPAKLDFGSHPIQTAEDQVFPINEGLGSIQVEDTRSGEKDWTMKVSQTNPWISETNIPLADSRLTLFGGSLQTTFRNGEVINYVEQGIQLRAHEQQPVFALKGVSDFGSITLPLNRAELFIPKNTPRIAATYETTLVWTLSESPNE